MPIEHSAKSLASLSKLHGCASGHGVGGGGVMKKSGVGEGKKNGGWSVGMGGSSVGKGKGVSSVGLGVGRDIF